MGPPLWRALKTGARATTLLHIYIRHMIYIGWGPVSLELRRRVLRRVLIYWRVPLMPLQAGCTPFDADTVETTMSRIVLGAYKFPSRQQFSSDSQALVSGLLQLDPRKRLSLEDVLNHRWLKR